MTAPDSSSGSIGHGRFRTRSTDDCKNLCIHLERTKLGRGGMKNRPSLCSERNEPRLKQLD